MKSISDYSFIAIKLKNSTVIMRFFIVLVLLAAGLQLNTQETLGYNIKDYSTLWDELREIARTAAKRNLNQIRNQLDYTKEGTSFFRSLSEKTSKNNKIT
jgi:hypothetical protein